MIFLIPTIKKIKKKTEPLIFWVFIFLIDWIKKN